MPAMFVPLVFRSPSDAWPPFRIVQLLLKRLSHSVMWGIIVSLSIVVCGAVCPITESDTESSGNFFWSLHHSSSFSSPLWPPGRQTPPDKWFCSRLGWLKKIIQLRATLRSATSEMRIDESYLCSESCQFWSDEAYRTSQLLLASHPRL